ncbi:MAG: hypothetical protein H0W18_12625 [Acidobacteria bacterium]|nr:hypothetical protein [Acidobacteriota bacterium]
MRDVASTPPPRLGAALQRLVSFYAATGQSEQAASWRSRLQAFDASSRAAKTGITSAAQLHPAPSSAR